MVAERLRHDVEDDDEDEDDEQVLLNDPVGANHIWGGQGNFEAGGDEVDPEDEEKLDRDQGLLQDACLPVSGPPLPPEHGPPKDADEYLRQVQWERMHCADVIDVKVEEIQPRRRNNRPAEGGGLLSGLDEAEADHGAPQVCEEWAEDVAAAFALLVEQCEHKKANARRNLGGAKKRPQGTDGGLKTTLAGWKQQFAAGPPATATLARQDFVSLNRLVCATVEALVNFQEEVAATSAGDTAADQPSATLDLERLTFLTEWVFAALAFADRPLIDDVQFQLQQLRRVCSKLLLVTAAPSGAAVVSSGAAAAAAESPLSSATAGLNMLLVLVTRVFGQH